MDHATESLAARKETIESKWPFLTLIGYLDSEYLGIVQNSDATWISMYVLDASMTADVKAQFIDCGESWWWGGKSRGEGETERRRDGGMGRRREPEYGGVVLWGERVGQRGI